MNCQEPHLGLATTRQLLEELRARGDINFLARPGERRLFEGPDDLLKELPDDLLNYRTVDS